MPGEIDLYGAGPVTYDYLIKSLVRFSRYCL